MKLHFYQKKMKLRRVIKEFWYTICIKVPSHTNFHTRNNIKSYTHVYINKFKEQGYGEFSLKPNRPATPGGRPKKKSRNPTHDLTGNVRLAFLIWKNDIIEKIVRLKVGKITIKAGDQNLQK